MRCLITIISLLVLPVIAQNPEDSLLLLNATTGSGAGGPPDLVKQDFEGAGYDNSETWLETSGPPIEDADYSTAPILGSQSLAMNRSGASSPQVYRYWNSVGGGTNKSEFWVVFAIRPTNTNLNNEIFSSMSNNVEYGFIYLRDTARLILYDSTGTQLASPADGIPTNIVTYIKAHWNYAAGTGDIEHSTSDAFIGSGTKFASGSGGAANGMMANRISLLTTAASSTNYFDFVRAYTTDPGANPL